MFKSSSVPFERVYLYASIEFGTLFFLFFFFFFFFFYSFNNPFLDWALLIETVYKYQTTWVGLANSPIPNGENVLPASATVMESVSGDELFYPMFLNAKPRA